MITPFVIPGLTRDPLPINVIWIASTLLAIVSAINIGLAMTIAGGSATTRKP